MRKVRRTFSSRTKNPAALRRGSSLSYFITGKRIKGRKRKTRKEKSKNSRFFAFCPALLRQNREILSGKREYREIVAVQLPGKKIAHGGGSGNFYIFFRFLLHFIIISCKVFLAVELLFENGPAYAAVKGRIRVRAGFSPPNRRERHTICLAGVQSIYVM
ncbi:MAG: hypothetical protein LBI91_01620 [Spirochaetaceae bacterium]|jgi:hypothetical protein|nr:hypothetical protein [Spirochaetaceae bacterium]